MIENYRIPKVFYDDHVSVLCLPAPCLVKQTKRHYWISKEETPELKELRANATWYVEMGAMGGFVDGYNGLVASARATLKVIGTEAVA